MTDRDITGVESAHCTLCKAYLRLLQRTALAVALQGSVEQDKGEKVEKVGDVRVARGLIVKLAYRENNAWQHNCNLQKDELDTFKLENHLIIKRDGQYSAVDSVLCWRDGITPSRGASP